MMSRPPLLTIGDVRVRLLSAGYQMGDGGVLHGIVPRALWSRYEQPDELNRVRMELRCLLIESDGLRILVDNGFGDKLAAKQKSTLGIVDEPGLAESLASVDLGVEDIDLMVDSHLHADHCGGNTTLRDDAVVPTFPHARYLIQRGEYAVASRPNERTRATYLLDNYRPLEDAGVVDFVEGDVQITSSVRLERAPGHTIDHCIVRINSQGQTVIFLADVAQRTVQLERIAWVAAYDVEPLVSLETKRRLLDEAAQQGHLLILQHDPAVGRLVNSAEGRRFQPIPLE